MLTVREGFRFASLLLLVGACSTPAPPAAERADTQGETASASYPRYDRVLLLETTAETSANVSIGDVDGDGHLDLVLAKGRHWPLANRVLLGDGRGQVRAAAPVSRTRHPLGERRVCDAEESTTVRAGVEVCQ